MNLGVIGWINRVQREEARVEHLARAEFTEVIAKIRQAEEESGMELIPNGASIAAKEVPAADLFISSYGARRLVKQAREAYDTAVTILTEEAETTQERVKECQAAVEAAEKEKGNTLDAAQRHKLAVSQAVAKELAALDERGEGFQQGCACGAGIGCLSLAGYAAFSLVMVGLGRQATVGSPIGIIFMTLFVVPIGISVLLQLTFGLKRMMVESELNAKVRQAEDLCDTVTEKANKAFADKEPELVGALERAEEAAKKVETALRNLKGEPEPEPEETEEEAKAED